MYDSTPLKTIRSDEYQDGRYLGRDENVRATRVATRRRSANGLLINEAARRDDDHIFDVLAVWDDSVSALREQVDIVSGWGPYELFESIPLFEGKDGRQRVLCRFVYHGAKNDHLSPGSQAQFKYALLNCLRQITEWEDVAGQRHVDAEPG